jgi:branched-chain amino acid transport system substrate-binding protein
MARSLQWVSVKISKTSNNVPRTETNMNTRWHPWLTALLLASIASIASAEDGISDHAILIGQTVGLTGRIAGAVKEMNEGAHAYIATVNRSGGVFGRKIEIRTLDDKFDAALAAANAEVLIKRDHVFALFQNRGTPHTEAILPILLAHGVPLIAPSNGAAVFHAPVNHFVFNVRAKYQDEVGKAVEHFSTVGIRHIGLVHVDDSFERDGLIGFSAAMMARKLTPAVVAKFDRIKPDIAATVDAVQKSSAGALIEVGSATTTAELIKSIRAHGGQMQIMTLSNNASQAFVTSLGTAAAGIIVSQITPAPHLVSSVLGQEFKLAAKASGATVSCAAMKGFVAVKVLVEGLRRAGRNPTREGFIRAGIDAARRSPRLDARLWRARSYRQRICRDDDDRTVRAFRALSRLRSAPN